MSANAKHVLQLIFQPFISLKSFRTMVLLVVLELVVALPLGSMVTLPGFSNLRPVTAFIPLYGIFFGPMGAWAYAIGNLSYDVLSGNLAISCIGGFYANWLAAMLWWLVASKLNSKDGLLGSGKSLVVFLLAAVGAATIVVVGISPWIAVFYSTDTAIAFIESVFPNNLFFFIMPGAGLTVILEKAYGLKPCLKT